MTSLEEVVFCHNCGNDLRITRVKEVPEYYSYGLEAIEWFENGLKNGYFIINGKKVNSVWVFQGMTRLYLKLDLGEDLVHNNFPKIEEYKIICRKLKRYSSKKSSLIYKSFFLNTMVYHLFQDYPNNLVSFAKDNKFTYRTFTHRFMGGNSFWYKNFIADAIPVQNKLGREITKDEIIGVIQYFKKNNFNITQVNIAKFIGCHAITNKSYRDNYKKLKLFL
ncbi:MAG: hypothetical protein DRG78_04075 [Epsilonproteobacteria bacterium]|nr:MAG: hypothetical protein DRG78_04075 [Campylobacterota bacterium]